jgi:hypothetical protein
LRRSTKGSPDLAEARAALMAGRDTLANFIADHHDDAEAKDDLVRLDELIGNLVP